tara:strand:+ start:434 stop:547 length:114 start_codon:yes stop_codon:yes gene_type:complete
MVWVDKYILRRDIGKMDAYYFIGDWILDYSDIGAGEI